MKKVVLIFSLIIIAISVNAYNIPQFTNYVVDEGNLLTGQEENQLNTILNAYEDSTSTQIAVLTLTSFDDENEGTLFDFSMDVFKNWKLGQKSKKNGVLLVVVQNLASKRAPGLRIVTGYGVEGSLPDAICKRIIESIRPSINEGRYYQGINEGIVSMISQMKGEYAAEISDDDVFVFIMVGFCALVLFIVFLFFILPWKDGDTSGNGSSYGRRSSGTKRRSSSNSDYTSYSTPSSYTDSGSSSSDSSSSFDGGGGGDSGGGGAGD